MFIVNSVWCLKDFFVQSFILAVAQYIFVVVVVLVIVVVVVVVVVCTGITT